MRRKTQIRRFLVDETTWQTVRLAAVTYSLPQQRAVGAFVKYATDAYNNDEDSVHDALRRARAIWQRELSHRGARARRAAKNAV